jgi:hypothetical protein
VTNLHRILCRGQVTWTPDDSTTGARCWDLWCNTGVAPVDFTTGQWQWHCQWWLFVKKTAWNSVSKKPKHNVWGHVKLQHQIPLVHLWCLKNGNQWAQVERTPLVYLKNGTVHVDIVRPAVPQKPLKGLIILTSFRWLRQICFQTNRYR